MPNINELAEVMVNGERFTDWETVSVETSFHEAARFAQFTVSENAEQGVTFATLQIKPGDRAEVYLAGIKVVTGVVFARQSAIDANSHQVLISVRDDSGEIVHGTVPMKDTQFRGYGFEQIARNLLQPYNINLSMVYPSSYSTKPFKDMNCWPGETVFQCLDRLAKLRGMFIRSDANGGLVVGGASTTAAGDLVEGQNLLSMSCLVRDDTIKSGIDVVGQGRGDNETSPSKAAQSKATAAGPSQYHRPWTILSEEPGDAEDFAARADHENAWLLGKTVECTAVVQGWLKPDGSLWSIEDCYTIYSPSNLLDNALLGPTSVVFTQDNSSGTRTTITMTRPEARNGPIGKVTEPAGSGNELPGGTLQPAEPVDG